MLLGKVTLPDSPEAKAARGKADAERDAALAARRQATYRPNIQRLPDFGLPPADQIERDLKHWQTKLSELDALPDLVDDWREAVRRGLAFTERYGREALRRGWTAADLFDVDELPSLHRRPPVLIGPALVIPVEGGCIFDGDSLVYRAPPRFTHVSNTLVQPETERRWRKARPLGRIVWALTPPRRREPGPTEIEHSIGVLGTLRWSGPTTAVVTLPAPHAGFKIELPANDILALVGALSKSPQKSEL